MSDTTLIVNYSCLTCLQVTSPPTAAAAAFTTSPLSPATTMACFSSLRRNKKEDKEEKTEKLKDGEKQRLSSDGTDFRRPYLKPELPPERHEPIKNAAPKKGILKKPQPKPKPQQQQQSVPRAAATSEERKRNRAEALAAREKQQLADLAEATFQPAMTGEQLAALKIIEKSNIEAAAAAEEEKKRKAQEHSHRRFSIPQSVSEDEEDEMNGIRGKGQPRPSPTLTPPKTASTARSTGPSSSPSQKPLAERYSRPLNVQKKGESIYSKPWPPENGDIQAC